jgi:spore maturation protein CgeB
VLVVDYRLLIGDLVRLFAQAGFAVRRLDPATLTIERFREACSGFAPQLVFAVNFSPEVAVLSTCSGLPYVSWTIDPLPASRLRVRAGTVPDLCLTFAHRRHLVTVFREAGLASTHLPLGAPADRRVVVSDAGRLARYRCPVSFVGSSLDDEVSDLRRFVARRGGDDALLERIDAWLRTVLRREASDCAFLGLRDDGEDIPGWILSALHDPVDRIRLAELLNGTLSSLLRRERIAALDGPGGVHVYGDPAWRRVVTGYRGPAQHDEELTLIYNASAINLDVPRIYQRDIVTMRVFDVLSSGGFLLTEPGEDLAAMLTDGRHLMTYRTTDELVEKVRTLSRDPELCRTIAAAGLAEVRAKHLLEHRFAHILHGCQQRGWLS